MFLSSFAAFGITSRLRNLTFSKLIKLPMSFYDDTKNSSGSLIQSLGSDVE